MKNKNWYNMQSLQNSSGNIIFTILKWFTSMLSGEEPEEVVRIYEKIIYS